VVTRLIALLLLAGSLLPVAAWIPGGEEDPAYWARLQDWMLGFALCAGVGALAWFMTRRRERAPVVGTAAPAYQFAGEWRFVFAMMAAAFALYSAIALWVFSGKPLLIDEIVHVLQAQDLASRRLTHAIPGAREFFSIMHVVDFGERAYGQYPVGGPAMLVPGVLLGATWLTGPLAGALCVGLFWVLARHTDPLASVAWRRYATVLFAIAPFGAFLFGSHMNHVTTLLWLMGAMVALGYATRTDAKWWWGLLAGFGFGIAATIRPLDAVAFAVPAGAWLAWRARRGASNLATLMLSGVGIALPILLMLWANAATTGDALRFGYDVLWGAGHSLGFHSSPWGPMHTPQRGVELISLYLTRLNTYLWETPFPALLLPAAGLWLTRTLQPMQRYLIATSALLGIGYWAYWHDGFYLGPRFLLPLLPWLVLWTARAVPLLRDRIGAASAAWRGVRAALIASVVYAAVTVVVVRVPTYHNGMRSMRIDPGAEAARAGVRDALVLVQESWGAQLMVRMWGVDVSRTDAEVLYRHVDACVLEIALSGVERDGVRGEDALERMRPLLVDSARLVPSHVSPDFTERMLPGFPYTSTCIDRIEEDRQGYLLYAPWRLARDSNVYARWLPGRETEIAASFPGRPVYRVRRDGTEVDAPLVWERLTLPTQPVLVSAMN